MLYHCLEVKTCSALRTSDLHAIWQAILRASLQHSSFSVEKFSRWLRTICTISLSRNTETDRTKAVGYIEQALTVMKDHCESHGDENNVSTRFLFKRFGFSDSRPLRSTLWMNVNGCWLRPSTLGQSVFSECNPRHYYITYNLKSKFLFVRRS